MNVHRASTIILMVVVLALGASAQQSPAAASAPASQQSPSSSMNMDGMPGMDHGNMQHADAAMSGHHHDMGPHMKMTALRTPEPGDRQKAEQVVEQVRQALERYQDYKAAQADGYKIFLPNPKQKMYHFTKNWYGLEAAFTFNPAHPTSLLYEKEGDGSFKLIGAMYTAPARFSEDDLNQRIPLSVAQWHLHSNLCLPPTGQRDLMIQAHPKFGLAGSISTREECEANGGRFLDHIFGWMVHVYPYQKNPADVWSLARQEQNMHQHMD